MKGSALPSETDLMDAFGVSRSAMREVLDLLRAEGIIERLQGAGTFVVAPERTTFPLDRMDGLLSSLGDESSRVTWDLLTLESLPAPELVAQKLQLPTGSITCFIERITRLDGEPVAARSSWLPDDIGSRLLATPGHARRSVCELVEEVLGHDVGYADVRIEATLADAAIAPLLGVGLNVPLIQLERVVRDSFGRPVEYGFSRLRGDRVSLTTVLSRAERPTSARRSGAPVTLREDA